MRKPKFASKTKQLSVSLPLEAFQIMDDMLVDKARFGLPNSYADIVRRGIVAYYQDFVPPSKPLGVKATKQLKEKAEKSTFNLVDPAIYAQKELKAVTGTLLEDMKPQARFVPFLPKGTRVAITHDMSNGFWFIPLDKIKTWKEDNEWGYNYHMQRIFDRPVLGWMQPMESFERNYGKIELDSEFITLPDNVSNQSADSGDSQAPI